MLPIRNKILKHVCRTLHQRQRLSEEASPFAAGGERRVWLCRRNGGGLELVLKDVTISIQGTQEVDGEENAIEMVASGTLCVSPEEFVLEYDEKDEDDVVSRTTLTVDHEGTATLQRDGPRGSRMMIQRGRRHLCHYDTAFGVLMIGVFGEQVAHNMTDSGGELYMRYTIDINSAMQSRNEVKITVKESKMQCLN